MRITIASCLLLLLFALQAPAEIPRTLSYQGVVKDAAGVILADGDYTFTFRLYDAASGGDALWSEQQVCTVHDGVFDAVLGTVTPLALSS